jgi:hypothetical protein
MKLNKDNFEKTVEGDVITYTYRCNETDFFLVVSGSRVDRQINVFKGSLENKEEELVTADPLEAWNYFETLLEICQPKQSSSGGGGGQKPEENPKLLPLLAIKFNEVSNMWDCILFVVLEDNTQQDVFNFSINPSAMPKVLPTKKVFTVDWSNEEIPMLLKSEVLLKDYPTVKFETHNDYEVFLFIPKSLVSQGGEEGGATEEPQGEGEPSDEEGGEPTDEKGGEPSDKKGKGKPKEDGEPTDEDGEPTDEDEEPSNEDGEPTDEDGEPTDKNGKGKPSDEGEPTDEEPDDEEPVGSYVNRTNAPQIIQELAASTETKVPVVKSIFRNAESGEMWLQENNFPKIIKDLNLPNNISAKELSTQIINAN